MKSILKSIINNLKLIFDTKTFLLVIFMINIVIIYKRNNYINYTNLNINFESYIQYVFFTSNKLLENISELMFWILYEIVFLILALKYIFIEFKVYNIYHISRLKSKFNWLISIEITLLITSMIFNFLAVCISYIYSPFKTISFEKLIVIYLLIVIFSLLISLVFILLKLTIKNGSISISILIFIIYLSFYVGYIFNINVYLPFNQMIFESYINFSKYIFSIAYIAILNFFISIVIYIKILSLDLTSKK